MHTVHKGFEVCSPLRRETKNTEIRKWSHTCSGSVPKPGVFMFALRYTASSGWSRTTNSLRGTGFPSKISDTEGMSRSWIRTYHKKRNYVCIVFIVFVLAWTSLPRDLDPASWAYTKNKDIFKTSTKTPYQLYLSLSLVESFACLEHKRHAAPPVVVDVKHHGGKGWRFWPSRHRGVVQVCRLNSVRICAVLTKL